jgi:hypothetical protein
VISPRHVARRRCRAHANREVAAPDVSLDLFFRTLFATGAKIGDVGKVLAAAKEIVGLRSPISLDPMARPFGEPNHRLV